MGRLGKLNSYQNVWQGSEYDSDYPTFIKILASEEEQFRVLVLEPL